MAAEAALARRAYESRKRRDKPMLPSGERARNTSCKHTFPLCVVTETLMHRNQFHSIQPILEDGKPLF